MKHSRDEIDDGSDHSLGSFIHPEGGWDGM